MSGAELPSTSNGSRVGGQGESRTLVEVPQDELIAKWEEFFEDAGYVSRIIQVADRYPEQRSIDILFTELNRFDTDMAIYLMRHPLNVLMAGEEAMRRLVPPGEELTQIHLRIKGLPRDSRIQIRDLRAKHLGQFISVEGLVRKSTEVRPRVVGALFQCLRCGTIIKEEQDGQNFREPLECYEEQGGCKRSASATKFKLLTETSMYLDTQKLEIQEAPEGLRGGEEPQRLTAYVEDDLTGRITPGQRVILNGVLRSVQKGRPGAKSTLFDIFVDVNSTEMETVEFEEIEITEEDVRQIQGIGSNPDIVRMMVSSIAPSIYGLHVEKEALALQLFSGVPKVMPDGRRIRGDIHLLLIGDPGTAKSELLSYMSRISPRGIYATGKAASAAGLCVAAGSLVDTPDGPRAIENVVEARFGHRTRASPVENLPATGEVATLDGHGRRAARPLEAVWRLEPPAVLLEVRTECGRAIRVTPATRLWIDRGMKQDWIPARFLRKGMWVAVSGRESKEATPAEREIRSSAPRAQAMAVLGPDLRGIRRFLGLRPSQAYGPRVEEGLLVERADTSVAQDRVAAVVEQLAEVHRAGEWQGMRIPLPPDTWTAIRKRLIAKGVTPHALAGSLGVTPRLAAAFLDEATRGPQLPFRGAWELARFLVRYDIGLAAAVEADVAPLAERSQGVSRQLDFLRTMLSSDLRWSRISEVRILPSPPGQNVYDLTVKDAHSFIANGILVHNTAAAVRDEFGEGRWTLEAGALVLADKGLACLHPDARVFADGRWTSVASLFPEGDVMLATSKGTPLEIQGVHWSTLGLRPETGRVGAAQVTLIARRPYTGPVIHAILESGAELRLTPDHPVMEGLTGHWKPLEDFRPTDTFVVADTHLPLVTVRAGGGAVAAAETGAHVERIKEARVESYSGYVYDLRIPEGENFLCDGVVVHNCIDELDKMNPQDRSAIHEALEQQRISVAKAGITAVLQARCAVLAAANPKFGRFDEHKYISEQIDLPPTLLSVAGDTPVLVRQAGQIRTRTMRDLVDPYYAGHEEGEPIDVSGLEVASLDP